MKPRVTVIVGAGFCGTLLAANLLRLGCGQARRIVLVDQAQIARGMAYRRLRYPWLLNVAAGRMSADPDDPLEFVRFASRWQGDVSADAFLPRELYGEYLESLLTEAATRAPPQVTLQRLYGHVIALERLARAEGFQVHLADARVIRADEVVLATGNPPPGPLPEEDRLRGSSRYLPDPWQAPPHFKAGESVLIAGTGLTMADIVLAGVPGERRRVTIHAVSRHGLLPLPQTPLSASVPERHQPDLGPLLRAASSSLSRLSRAVRSLSQEAVEAGGDWQAVITTVREIAPALWQRLPAEERDRFNRHLRTYWDVHRHRLPRDLGNALQELRRDGQLHVHAGRILGLEPTGKKVRVTFRVRGQFTPSTLLVDRVVNCTGPNYDPTQTDSRLLRSLLAQGVAQADPLRLGLVTDESSTLISAGGSPSRHLYYIGPLLRASYWETTAVAELRQYARRLAQHLCVVRKTAPRFSRSWHRETQAVQPGL